jgi:exopolyphosphatase/guanosine-5'-triphosphate,3'-diphosphate pyrophosphatase
MRIGVVDIGSNTARLLDAERDGSRVRTLREERALLALGDEVERLGSISDVKIAETAKHARAYARIARSLGCEEIDVIVTAPGRQSLNARVLLRALERSTGVPVRVLSAEEEGALAFEGAVARARDLSGRVAVCDVGGGSTEIVVGTGATGPELVRSLDIGSLRLTRRWLPGDPPGRRALRAAGAEVAERFDGADLPRVDSALATGGTARALRRVTGSRVLGESELAGAVKRLAKRPAGTHAELHGLDPLRAATLLGGALIVAEAQRRLGVSFEVARGGLREGAVVMRIADSVAA